MPRALPQARGGRAEGSASVTTLEEEIALGHECSIVALMDALLLRAHSIGASDIHIDPTAEAVRVRLRVDGVLQDVASCAKILHHELISRIKILAGLRTDEHQSAQDGRLRHPIDAENFIDVRVSMQFYVVDAATLHLSDGLGQNAVATGMNAVTVASSTATGSHAYVAVNSASTQLEIIDVSPKTPIVVAAYHVPTASTVAKSISFKDGYVYLGLANNPTGAEFVVIDAHAHPAPFVVGTYEVGAGVNAIQVKNGRAYLATDDAHKEVVILDILDLTHPSLLAWYDAPGAAGSGYARSLYLVGTTVYLGRYYSLSAVPEFALLDVSVTPSLVGSVDVGPASAQAFSVYGVVARGTRAFVLSGSPSAGGALQIFDTKNPVSPLLVHSVALPNTGAGVALDCEYGTLYAVSVPASGTNANKASLTRISP